MIQTPKAIPQVAMETIGPEISRLDFEAILLDMNEEIFTT